RRSIRQRLEDSSADAVHARGRRPAGGHAGRSPRMISIIIPAYNEEALLDGTLTAIRAAAETLASPYEVIVVDDGSTDRTAAIASAHGARVVTVKLRHIAAARN